MTSKLVKKYVGEIIIRDVGLPQSLLLVHDCQMLNN